MITLRDLFDQDQLGAAIGDGYVRVQHHPTLPLVIMNYTERAAYERAWNPVTITCRGLISHRATGEVVARAFDKFWNAHEPESAGIVTLDEPVTVTDKVDGSLGVLVPVGDGEFIVATRGSFTSVQAAHATEVWQRKYAGRWSPPIGMTALFEIVFPANRIVLDYGDLDDLVLLGFVEIETGRTHGPDALGLCWPGPRAKVLPYRSYAEALADEPREGIEGYVVHFLDSDRRVKLKGSWYVELHKIVTGLNARVVWQHLRDGLPLADLIAPLPDEFHAWTARVAEHLRGQVAAMSVEIENAYKTTQRQLPPGYSRKEYALLIKGSPFASALFLREDDRDYRPLLWRQIDPGAEWRPSNTPTEEAA